MVRPTVVLALVVLLPAACGESLPAGEAGEACGGCAEVYAQGGVVCGDTPSASAWQALTECACTGACGSACSASFCTSAPADQMCGTCLAAACPALATACSKN